MSSSHRTATAGPGDDDVMQRVLFVCQPVRVYAIPPLRSIKGYKAAYWTGDGGNGGREIFVARMRVVESASRVMQSRLKGTGGKENNNDNDNGEEEEETRQLSVEIRLEEPTSGELFAASPYTDPSAVEQTLDSSRFFAICVVGGGSEDGAGGVTRKAILGIGFEDRNDAFDFGVCLQEVRKILATNNPANNDAPVHDKGKLCATSASAARRGLSGQQQQQQPPSFPPMTNYSLKPGEMIHLNMGRHKSYVTSSQEPSSDLAPSRGLMSAPTDPPSAFVLPPPPPPPNTASRDQRRRCPLRPS